MSGTTTEEKKSIFAKAYNWLKLKAIAFKDAVVGAFVSIKNWFKSLSLFKTEPLACCAGGKPNAGAAATAPAPQQLEVSVAVTPPTGAGDLGAAVPTVEASATVDGVPATATALTADALTVHNAAPQPAANDEGDAHSAGSRRLSRASS